MVILLDTNLLIDHLRLQGNSSRYYNLIATRIEETFAISPVTIQELYTGESTKKSQVKKEVDETLSELEILPYNTNVSELAGTLARDYKLTFADAAIAATALFYDAELATLNTKDFSGIPQLKLLSL